MACPQSMRLRQSAEGPGPSSAGCDLQISGFGLLAKDGGERSSRISPNTSCTSEARLLNQLPNLPAEIADLRSVERPQLAEGSASEAVAQLA